MRKYLDFYKSLKWYEWVGITPSAVVFAFLPAPWSYLVYIQTSFALANLVLLVRRLSQLRKQLTKDRKRIEEIHSMIQRDLEGVSIPISNN